MILEDDFTFLITKEEFEILMNKFFDEIVNVEYNVCMISYNLLQKTDSIYDFLWKALDVQTSSGYIINSNYFDVLIELFEKTVPLLNRTK